MGGAVKRRPRQFGDRKRDRTYAECVQQLGNVSRVRALLFGCRSAHFARHFIAQRVHKRESLAVRPCSSQLQVCIPFVFRVPKAKRPLKKEAATSRLGSDDVINKKGLLRHPKRHRLFHVGVVYKLHCASGCAAIGSFRLAAGLEASAWCSLPAPLPPSAGCYLSLRTGDAVCGRRVVPRGSTLPRRRVVPTWRQRWRRRGRARVAAGPRGAALWWPRGAHRAVATPAASLPTDASAAAAPAAAAPAAAATLRRPRGTPGAAAAEAPVSAGASAAAAAVRARAANGRSTGAAFFAARARTLIRRAFLEPRGAPSRAASTCGGASVATAAA